MRNKIEQIIIKHYSDGNNNWEKCGQEIQDLIRKEEDKIKNKNYPYMQECNKIDQMRRNIEGIYESYFTVGTGNFFDWVNGNGSLKELLNSN